MKDKATMKPYETIESLHQLDFLELRKESDRGLVLIFSEYINEFLRRILAFEVYKKTNNISVVDELFADSRTFGTFNSRLLAAYGFGILQKKAYYTIHFIRKIRNVFAHETTVIDLNSPKLEPFVSELRKLLINEWATLNKTVGITENLRIVYENESPRQIFGVSCSTIIAFLYGLRHGKLEAHLGHEFEEQSNPGMTNFWVKL